MIAKVFVFVCAIIGLAAASCVEVVAPQRCSSRLVSLSAGNDVFFSEPSFNTPVISKVVSADPFCSEKLSAPVITRSVLTAPIIDDEAIYAASGFTRSGVVSDAEQDVVIPAGKAYLRAADSEPIFQGPLGVVDSPPLSLSTTLPPKVIASRCICTKTVIRPQIYQRVVTVPKIHRYLKRTITPVIENIVYKTRPVAGVSGTPNAVVVSRTPVVLSENSSPVLVSGSSCTCSKVC